MFNSRRECRYASKNAGQYSLTNATRNPSVSKPKSRNPAPEKKENSLIFTWLMGPSRALPFLNVPVSTSKLGKLAWNVENLLTRSIVPQIKSEDVALLDTPNVRAV